uniref:Uncharacterized protein n=1 Tax=Apteryx owenii TaxID=8824 RepID=A0A8B9NS96_APTOW
MLFSPFRCPFPTPALVTFLGWVVGSPSCLTEMLCSDSSSHGPCGGRDCSAGCKCFPEKGAQSEHNLCVEKAAILNYNEREGRWKKQLF